MKDKYYNRKLKLRLPANYYVPSVSDANFEFLSTYYLGNRKFRTLRWPSSERESANLFIIIFDRSQASLACGFARIFCNGRRRTWVTIPFAFPAGTSGSKTRKNTTVSSKRAAPLPPLEDEVRVRLPLFAVYDTRQIIRFSMECISIIMSHFIVE